MNNKGFAISIILYSIVFLIITILYMLLGIVRQRYIINENLREEITKQINTEYEVELPPENIETNGHWVCDSTHLSTDECYEAVPPEHPIIGDIYIQKFDDIYGFRGSYTCQGITNYFSSLNGQYYGSESAAIDACSNSVNPSCAGILTTNCEAVLYHKCHIYRFESGNGPNAYCS